MMKISDLKMGDEIKATKNNKTIKGIIVKIHASAVVIVNHATEDREVVDIDKIDCKIKE